MSAPSYAHGVIDPVAQIAAIASEAGRRAYRKWTLKYGREAPL